MNNRKIMTVAIILVAVIALSIGFAAFSSTLNIQSEASVNPNASDFSVKFSKQENVLDESNVVATSIVGANVEAMDAKIDNSNSPTITDLNVSFTRPGESVTYEFYVMNTGEYKAYLRDVEFKRSVNGVDFISCKAGDGATDSLVEQACKGMKFELTIGDKAYTPGDEIEVQELAKNTSKKVVVKIIYEENSVVADGPFTVDIGDVSLSYASTMTGDYQMPEEPEEVVATDASCFVSVIPGEINKYVCDDTDVVIPANLELAPVEVDSVTFNSAKCSAVESFLDGLSCDTLATQIPYMTNEQIFGTVAGALVDITYTEKTVTTPITAIGIGAFALNNLTSANIPGSIDNINDYAFAVNEINELTLAYGLDTIGEAAFFWNNLTSITLPDSITTIGNISFQHNPLSGELVIPSNVVTIGKKAFSGGYDNTNAINKLTFESGSKLETIGDDAFAHNQLSGEILIPANVETIGEEAFFSNNIQSLIFENGSNVETIGLGAFEYNRISGELVIPASVVTIGSAAFESNQLSELTFESGSNLQTIGEKAFEHNYLTNLIVPDSVTTIGSRAFGNNNLTSIQLGSGINSFGSEAFKSKEDNQTYGRNAITNVSIKALKSNVTFEYSNVFEWASGSNCATWTGDIKDNPCITWVNG